MFARRKRALSALASGIVVLTMSLCACGGGGSQPTGEESEPHTHAPDGGEHTH